MLRLRARLHLIISQVIRELGLVVAASVIELLPGEVLGVGEVGPLEAGPLEVGLLKVGKTEVGLLEVGV